MCVCVFCLSLWKIWPQYLGNYILGIMFFCFSGLLEGKSLEKVKTVGCVLVDSHVSFALSCPLNWSNCSFVNIMEYLDVVGKEVIHQTAWKSQQTQNPGLRG